MSRWLAGLVVVASATVADAAPPSLPPTCVARFERARAELIERGFAPTTDKDTRRWLTVTQTRSSVQLSLELRTSADGAATFYMAFVEHPRVGLEPRRWHERHGPYCCNEHATKEDHLFQHLWARTNGWLRATVSIVEFAASQDDPAIVKGRDLFAQVAREAGDDCLAIRRR